jgi:hypothetical protein
MDVMMRKETNTKDLVNVGLVFVNVVFATFKKTDILPNLFLYG